MRFLGNVHFKKQEVQQIKDQIHRKCFALKESAAQESTDLRLMLVFGLNFSIITQKLSNRFTILNTLFIAHGISQLFKKVSEMYVSTDDKLKEIQIPII